MKFSQRAKYFMILLDSLLIILKFMRNGMGLVHRNALLVMHNYLCNWKPGILLTACQ